MLASSYLVKNDKTFSLCYNIVFIWFTDILKKKKPKKTTCSDDINHLFSLQLTYGD